MEQNNFNSQGSTATETREPLPTLDFSAQPPVFTQTAESHSGSNPEVDACAESAFGKSLAAAIMAWFPVCSIIAIILGSGGLKMVKRANELAAHYGVSAGGKTIAAKVLGIVGKIAGIVMTVIYSIYFVVIVGMIGSLM